MLRAIPLHSAQENPPPEIQVARTRPSLQTSTLARARELTEREDEIRSVAPFEPPLQRVNHSTANGEAAAVRFAMHSLCKPVQTNEAFATCFCARTVCSIPNRILSIG
jgi:hypothetical protein